MHKNQVVVGDGVRKRLERLIDRLGSRLAAGAPVIVVSSIEMKFVRPAVLDDALTVKTRIKLLRRASVIFEQTIMRGEETICTAQVRCASVDMKLGVPTQADPRILAALKPYAPDDSI